MKEVSSYEKAARQNGQLRVPTARSERREEILALYAKEGYGEIERRFRKENRVKLAVAFVVDRIPVSVKKMVRRILK